MSGRRGARSYPQRETIKLRGQFTDFRQHTVTGWGTGKLVPHDGGEPIAIKGVIVGGRPGDSVEMEGYWTDHPQYGRTFAVISCVTLTPQTVDAVVAWMSSKLPGVGESRARELLAHFGGPEGLWKVIESSPERLAEIGGITAERALSIQRAYAELASERDHMIALRGWGLTDNQVKRCKDEWSTLSNVVDHIRANPYELCYCVDGFGFKRADVVAQRVGIGKDSIERMIAGVVYTLDGAITDGHCFLWGGQLQRLAAETLELDAAIVGKAIGEAWRRGYVVRRGKRIYSQRLERAEADCAESIAQLLTNRKEKEETHVYH